MQKQANDDVDVLLGATLEPVKNNDQERLGLSFGMQVTKLQKGKLSDAGVREGFIILRIDKLPIKTATDVKNALNDASGGILIEGVYPNGLRAYYGVGW